MARNTGDSPPRQPKLEWQKIRQRTRVLALAVTLSLFLLALRLFQFQVIQGAELASKAVSQRTAALALHLDRGTIYDRNLRALHAPYTSWNLVAYTPFVNDPAWAARQIAARLGAGASSARLGAAGVSAAELQAKLDPGNGDGQGPAPGFVRILDQLPPAVAARVPSWNLPGIVAVPYQERYGPGAVAQHVVGYINRADNRGVAGLERAFDDVITGTGGQSLLAMFDPHQRPLSPLRLRGSDPLRSGHDLVTTIDWDLQAQVQDILARGGQPGAAVVVDAKNGDILAMASHPTFEQHRIADYLDGHQGDPLVNRAVRPFPPGSVFKTVVAAAALEEGILSSNSRVPCSGAFRIGDRTFHSRCPEGVRGRDVDGAGGVVLVDWKDAMAQSNNEVFIRLGLELGAERLLSAARDYGFGQNTGLPLPEELPGVVPAAGDVRYAGDLANLAMGQGRLAVTPVQVAQFFTALVNNGEMQPLRLLQEIRRADGVLLQAFRPAPRRRVMTTSTAALLRRALRMAVLEGTGVLAELPRHGAAGKTGTAETGRSLSDGRQLSHAWFAGFVPASLPRYVIVVFIEDGMSGPNVAAPKFREIARAVTLARGGA